MSITSYQTSYFVAQSFSDAQKRLEKWVVAQDKPLFLSYNSYSRNVSSYPKNTWRMLQEQIKKSNFSF